MAELRQPARPSLWQVLRALPRLRRDPLGTIREAINQHGDFIRLPGPRPTFLVSDPADIRHVMVTNGDNYHKTGGLKIGWLLFGQGLLASEEPLHMKQRKLMQPMFHARRMANFAAIMSEAGEQLVARWRPGETLDFSEEMMRVTVAIVSRTLFSVDLSAEAPEINHALTEAQRHIMALVNGLTAVPPLFRRGRERRYRQAIETLDRFVYDMIEGHRREPGRYDDLLSMLIDSRYEDGSPMSTKQIRDEVMNLLLAGHETTANALAWLFFELQRNPEVEARLLAEYEAVLGGRAPTFEDVPRLAYTSMVFAETLRLYPPVWMQARRALADDQLPSGGRIPAGAEIAMMTYAIHRNPAFFPDPDRFDAERFSPAARSERPQFAYFPFAGGSRLCLGEGFAKLEAVLILAILLPRFRLTLEPGHPVEPEPLLTLRPKHGLRMRVERRVPAPAGSAA